MVDVKPIRAKVIVKGGNAMSRKVFDKLTSAGGIVAVVVLLVAGGLLTWGHSFVNSNVHSQLAQQQISFPPQARVRASQGRDRDHPHR